MSDGGMTLYELWLGLAAPADGRCRAALRLTERRPYPPAVRWQDGRVRYGEQAPLVLAEAEVEVAYADLAALALPVAPGIDTGVERLRATPPGVPWPPRPRRRRSRPGRGGPGSCSSKTRLGRSTSAGWRRCPAKTRPRRCRRRPGGWWSRPPCRRWGGSPGSGCRQTRGMARRSGGEPRWCGAARPRLVNSRAPTTCPSTSWSTP